MEVSQKKSTKKNVLAYFASTQGQAMLEKLKKDQVSSQRLRENSTNGGKCADDRATHDPSLVENDRSQSLQNTPLSQSRFGGSTPTTQNQRLSLDDENSKNASSTCDHVSAPCWDGRIPSQSQRPHQHIGAYPGSETSRGKSTGVVDADVCQGGDLPTRNQVVTLPSTLALGGQLSLEQELLQQTIKPSKAHSDDMGLGMLEFGFPFRARGIGTERKPKAKNNNRVAISDPPDVAEAATTGACVRALPNNSRVVLVQDASIDPLDIDSRGLPRTSTVVLITEGPYIEPELEREIRGIPQDVKTPQRQRRHNAMRDTVRFRMKVFHPDYTEKTEFSFTTPIRPVGPKRRVSGSASVPEKIKRARDDDIETPVFSEKQPAIEPELVQEAGPSVHIEEEEADDDDDDEELYEVPILQQPTPPESIPSTPIISPTEELTERAMVVVIPRIREAVISPINPQPEEVELPPSPEILPQDIELPLSPVLQPEDYELPPSPIILAVEEVEEVEVEEEEEAPEVTQQPSPAPSIKIDEFEEELNDELVDSGYFEPEEEKEEVEKVLEEEKEEEKEENMKIVPYIPLTPPVTPHSNRRGLERSIDFLPSRDIFPPTPSSLMDSPVSIRGKDIREFDFPILTLPPPPAPSPPPMLQESPLISRKLERKVETIKEEDEDEDDIEEIIRSPPMSYIPSPPCSPAPSIKESPSPYNKGKEIAFPITQQPSPPASILDVPISNDEEENIEMAIVPVAREPSPPTALTPPPPPCLESPLALTKGKEREITPSHGTLVRQPSRLSLPETILDEEEFVDDSGPSAGNYWTAEDIWSPATYDSRPHTPASSVGTLSRRWSGISRMSYNTNITTPPQTRPGSALGTPSHHQKMLTWNNEDFFLDRSSSVARRDLFRSDSTISRKAIRESRLEFFEPAQQTLRPRYSLPLIREEWEIRYPVVMSPAEAFMVDEDADEDEYEISTAAQLKLLPITRGVISAPPVVVRRRTTTGVPQQQRRRKVRSMIEYTPDETLEGINELFEDLEKLNDVKGEIRAVDSAPIPSSNAEAVAAEEKKKGLLKRLRTKASGIKKKVVDRMEEKSEARLIKKQQKKSSSSFFKGKGKAVEV